MKKVILAVAVVAALSVNVQAQTWRDGSGRKSAIAEQPGQVGRFEGIVNHVLGIRQPSKVDNTRSYNVPRGLGWHYEMDVRDVNNVPMSSRLLSTRPDGAVDVSRDRPPAAWRIQYSDPCINAKASKASAACVSQYPRTGGKSGAGRAPRAGRPGAAAVPNIRMNNRFRGQITIEELAPNNHSRGAGGSFSPIGGG